MPFDGSEFETGLVRLFDAMLAFFGPNGERWTQGLQIDEDGSRCLIGALAGCRAKLKMPKGDRAARYLRAAIRRHQRGDRLHIIQFNDGDGTGFDDIRDVIVMAREMAISKDTSYRDNRQQEFSFT